jgi:carboxymethylenebutenolidase
MTTSTIKITAADGGEFEAYLSVPASGKGPGLVLLQEIFGINAYMRTMADHFAEEGYTVIVPDLFWRLQPGLDLGYCEEDFQTAFGYYQKFDVDQSIKDIQDTINHVKTLPQQVGKVGTLGYCLGGKLAFITAARTNVDCAISYYGVGIDENLDEVDKITCPMVMHFAELDKFAPSTAVSAITKACASNPELEIYEYPNVDHAFATPERDSYHKPSALIAYSRSISLLRRKMGPLYDLSQLWDTHCLHEFVTRDVAATMATMVAQPYVNHIPTMTGGVGHDHLKRFYKYHFVNSNPEDTNLIPISRTVGTDRIVDELLFCFTHTCEIDWMLPGLEPTGKRVEIPLVAIVCFRGDKLYHEHIYWDQASVLVQIGKLDPQGLPVAGIETARKLLDENLPSNSLMSNAWQSSENKPL